VDVMLDVQDDDTIVLLSVEPAAVQATLGALRRLGRARSRTAATRRRRPRGHRRSAGRCDRTGCCSSRRSSRWRPWPSVSAAATTATRASSSSSWRCLRAPAPSPRSPPTLFLFCHGVGIAVLVRHSGKFKEGGLGGAR
jgi:hypothetical protein